MIEMTDRSPFLEIRFFGALEVLVNGVALSRLRTRKGYSLLALLVLRRSREMRRDWLAATLWPDSEQSQSQQNLRICLSDLRKALGSQAGRIQSPSPRTLSMNLTDAYVDIVEFDMALERGDPESLRSVTTLYRGPFMEGWDEDWAAHERQIREEAYLGALEILADNAMEHKDWSGAARFFRQIVICQPSRESAQQRLMEALSADGDYAAVTEAFRKFRLYVHDTLQSSPSEETIAIYQRVRTRARASFQERSASAQTAMVLPLRKRPALNALPRPLTKLVGREREIKEIITCLRTSRLVTLTGIGGIGKTRLAIAVADTVEEDYLDGIAFVDLSRVNSADSVNGAVAVALGVIPDQTRTIVETIAAFLSTKSVLLVLNNCEHLLDACTSLAITLFHKSEGLSILCTSRQLLGITGEIVWRVPPLSLPSPEDDSGPTPESVARIQQFAAVQLFIERAREASPSFRLTLRNCSGVAKAARLLDGIPLALELAAAWVRAIPIEHIAARLENRLTLPPVSKYGKSTHQQTIEGALDSSYSLLSESEQTLMRQVSVFMGGWTIEAAEAVCILQDGDRDEVIENLTALVDKSLICYADSDGNPRYWMLETTRLYARNRLNQDEYTLLADRHARFYVQKVQEPNAYSVGNDSSTRYTRMEKDYGNFLTALDWLGDSRNPAKALTMATMLCKFWCAMGYLTEGRERMQKALAEANEVPDDERARALNGAGSIAFSQGDYTAALRYQQQSLSLYRRLDNSFGVAIVLCDVGVIAQQRNDIALARASFMESHERMFEMDNVWGIGYTLQLMGQLALESGDYADATTCFETSLSLMRRTQNRDSMALCLACMGQLLHRQGHLTSAYAYFQESLSLRIELGDKHGILGSFEDFAFLAFAQGEKALSARLFGMAARLREWLAVPLQANYRAQYNKVISALRLELSEPVCTSEWAAGREMTIQQAVADLSR